MIRNSTIETSPPSPLSFLFPQEDKNLPVPLANTLAVPQVRVAFAPEEGARSSTRNASSSVLADMDPPAGRVSEAQANRALAKICRQVESFGDKTTGDSLNAAVINEPIAIGVVTQMSVATMMAEISLLTLNALSQLAQLKLEGQKMLTEFECELAIEKADKVQQELDAAAEEAKVAKGSEIANCVFSWLVGIADLISGVVKVLTGNVVGGIADIGAGISGVGKAVCETMLLNDPKNESLRETADAFGTAQTVCSVASMVTSGVSVGSLMRASMPVIKTTTKTLSGEMGEQLMKEVGKNSSKGITEVSEQIANHVVRQSGNLPRTVVTINKTAAAGSAAQKLRDAIQKSVHDMFSPENLTKVVKESVEEAAKTCAKKGAVTAKELADEVKRTMYKRMMTECLRATRSIATEVRLLVDSVLKPTVNSLLGLRRADLQKEIEDLQNLQVFLSAMLDYYARSRETKESEMKDVIDKQVNAMDSIVQSQHQNTATLVRVASYTA
jgi:secreted effector protein SseC